MPSIKSASRERVERIRVDGAGVQLNCDSGKYSARQREVDAERELRERGEPVNNPRW